MKENWTTLFLELREEDLCKFSGKFKILLEKAQFFCWTYQICCSDSGFNSATEPHKQLKPSKQAEYFVSS